jgi:hypothetical protein
VRVIDDCSKFHLQNSVELLDDDIDIELKSPCHLGSPSRGATPIINTPDHQYDSIGFLSAGNEQQVCPSRTIRLGFRGPQQVVG